MTDALVFNGPFALDFQDIRVNVLRIPEVSIRLKQASQIWEQASPLNSEFHDFMLADDDSFLNNYRLKSLITAIVQVGLYDRYVKNFRQPQYFIGPMNGDSALLVCCGKKDFAELIFESEAFQWVKKQTLETNSSTPQLCGLSLIQYGAFELTETGSLKKTNFKGELQQVSENLIEKRAVKKLINIGPGNALIDKDSLECLGAQIIESIDLDPMLNWFWDSVQAQAPA